MNKSQCDPEHLHKHDHIAACGCGHSHEHHHEPEGHEHHVPGHPADCQCELCHPHEEYCDVCGESLENCTCRMPDADCVKRVYTLKNLGCANCAAKMEHKIKELPGVEYAAVSFVTKQLRLSAKDHEALLPAIREICTAKWCRAAERCPLILKVRSICWKIWAAPTVPLKWKKRSTNCLAFRRRR